MDGARVDADLVGACTEDLLDIVKGAESPAHGQRQEKLVCCPLDQIDDNSAFLLGRSDIEEYNLVCALLVIPPGQFNRVAGIAEAEKVCPLHHPAILQIEAGDDPSREHHRVQSLSAYTIYISHPVDTHGVFM